MSDQKNLFKALVDAQTKVAAVGKASQGHGYKYASSEDMISEAREALNAAGLAVFCSGISLDRTVDRGSDVVFDVRAEFTVVHGESGESMTHQTSHPAVVGRGRPDDKATAAARTTALGYYLRDLLQIPRVDDEVDRRDDQDWAPNGARQRRNDRQNPPPAPPAPAIPEVPHEQAVGALMAVLTPLGASLGDLDAFLSETAGQEVETRKLPTSRVLDITGKISNVHADVRHKLVAWLQADFDVKQGAIRLCNYGYDKPAAYKIAKGIRAKFDGGHFMDRINTHAYRQALQSVPSDAIWAWLAADWPQIRKDHTTLKDAIRAVSIELVDAVDDPGVVDWGAEAGSTVAYVVENYGPEASTDGQ